MAVEYGAIGYVTSAVTLTAFVVAVVANLLRKRLNVETEQIAHAPEAERPELVRLALEKFALEPLPTSALSGEQVVTLGLEQLRERRRRMTVVVITVIVLAIISAGLSIYALSIVNRGESGRAGASMTAPIIQEAPETVTNTATERTPENDRGGELSRTAEAERRALRERNELQAVTIDKEGMSLDALPSGIYGFMEPRMIGGELHDARVTAEPRPSLIEVHKRQNGEVWIAGFVSKDTSRHLNHPSLQQGSDFAFTMYTDILPEATVLVPRRFNEIKQQPSMHPTSRGGREVYGLDLLLAAPDTEIAPVIDRDQPRPSKTYGCTFNYRVGARSEPQSMNITARSRKEAERLCSKRCDDDKFTSKCQIVRND